MIGLGVRSCNPTAVELWRWNKTGVTPQHLASINNKKAFTGNLIQAEEILSKMRQDQIGIKVYFFFFSSHPFILSLIVFS